MRRRFNVTGLITAAAGLGAVTTLGYYAFIGAPPVTLAPVLNSATVAAGDSDA